MTQPFACAESILDDHQGNWEVRKFNGTSRTVWSLCITHKPRSHDESVEWRPLFESSIGRPLCTLLITSGSSRPLFPYGLRLSSRMPLRAMIQCLPTLNDRPLLAEMVRFFQVPSFGACGAFRELTIVMTFSLERGNPIRV